MNNNLPFPLPPLSFFTNLAETALNQALQADLTTRDSLAELSGKTISLNLQGPELVLYIFPNEQGVDILAADEEDVEHIDATIQTMPITLARTFFERDLSWAQNPDWSLSGDINVARQLINNLLDLEIDWEELIAKRIGDVPARLLGRFFEQGMPRRNGLQQRLRHFLQKELHALPSTQEIDDFVENVTVTEQQVNALAERIDVLKNS
ncbi:MAG: SCP2 sterol-binding domain-containing protein [Pseudomonadota bacterium]